MKLRLYGKLVFALLLCLGLVTLSAHAEDASAASDFWLGQLCGMWISSGENDTALYERWWWVGDALHGEGGQLRDGLSQVTEHLRIVPSLTAEQGYDYLAQPVDQALTAFRGQPEDDLQARRWLNPIHDFPQLIRYRLENDHLDAYVTRQDDVKLQYGRGWRFQREAPCRPKLN